MPVRLGACEKSLSGKFRPLLRLNRKAQRQEQSAKNKIEGFLVFHLFPLTPSASRLTPIWF